MKIGLADPVDLEPDFYQGGPLVNFCVMLVLNRGGGGAGAPQAQAQAQVRPAAMRLEPGTIIHE